MRAYLRAALLLRYCCFTAALLLLQGAGGVDVRAYLRDVQDELDQAIEDLQVQ